MEKVSSMAYLKNGRVTKMCADGIYPGSTSMGLGTLNFDISVSGGCISAISSGVSGWTLGMSYTDGPSNLSCTSGTTCGYNNYNLFFEGVGTIYSASVCYSITLNC